MEKEQIKRILAKNRYAVCPENVNKRQFSAIRAAMEKQFLKEWLSTPEGLYTDSQIWKQTFNKYL